MLQEIFERFPCILTKLLILFDKFCRHIQKHAFLCATKIVLQKQSAKIDLKVPWKSCDEIWWQYDEIHVIVNLGQKYEGEFIVGISFLVWFFNFLQMLWLSSSVNKQFYCLSFVISHVEFIVSALCFKWGWG